MKSILFFAATFLLLDSVFCQTVSEAEQSPFVRRMMSLDRDKDGVLSAAELPGTMKPLLQHDKNSDGKLDTAELALAEQAARSSRNGHVTETVGSSRKGRRARGAGGTRRPGGSPLDPAQIIRFAKSFDADRNGILSAAELKEYATALAARKTRDSNNSKSPESEQSSGKKPPVGLKAPGSVEESNPFDSNTKKSND